MSAKHGPNSLDSYLDVHTTVMGHYVDQDLSVVSLGPPLTVQTSDYSYNASLAGKGNIFRYCSPHADHNTYHHRHAFDVFAGDVEGKVGAVGGDWPTLGDVIKELHEWTCTHSDKLPT